MSFVADELSPSFSSSRVTRTCSASRMNAEMPRAPSVDSSVRAKRRNVPAKRPFVIHCFAPVIAQPSPAGSALVRSAPASEPASGSVSANAPITSPRARGGTKRDFCSSVPNVRIGNVVALLRHADSHETELGELSEELAREPMLAIPLCRVRLDALAREVARKRLDLPLLRAELEVHGRSLV